MAANRDAHAYMDVPGLLACCGLCASVFAAQSQGCPVARRVAVLGNVGAAEIGRLRVSAWGSLCPAAHCREARQQAGGFA